LGSQRYDEILQHIDRLEYHQEKWKSIRRVDRSIQYQLKKGLITDRQANWYSERPLLWYGRELLRILGQSLKKILIELPAIAFNKLVKIPDRQFIWQFWRFLSSQSYRLTIAKNHLSKIVNYWTERNPINFEEANGLLQHLERETSSEYLNDFGVHIGIKLFIKMIEYLVPLLYLTGLIDELFFITWLLEGQSIEPCIRLGE
jgi:hypothetical protein